MTLTEGSEQFFASGSLFDHWKSGFCPPPRYTVSEFAELERRLSAATSSEPGKWRNKKTPFLKAIMDAMNDPETDTVVFMKSSQVGGTEALLNIILYGIGGGMNGGILVLQPNEVMARAFSKDRLQPMLAECPVLKGIVSDPDKRDGKNELLSKHWPGGFLSVIPSGSAAQIASRPVKWVLLDETTKYESNPGGEGDVIDLAMKRSMTFWDRKHFICSTPTTSESNIVKWYERSDKRLFEVPCPKCSKFQALQFKMVKWSKKDGSDAGIECNYCNKKWNESERIRALSKGEWTSKDKFNGIAGFWINGLYSPWIKPTELAKEFLSATGDPLRLQVVVNTLLGEPWTQDHGEIVDPLILIKRLESWELDKIPQKVLVVTAGVDIQEDRIEVAFWGWGKSQESWLLDTNVIDADPTTPLAWDLLDDALQLKWTRIDGIKLRVNAVAVDSGFSSQQVYRFVLERRRKFRIIAVKGIGGEQRPLLGRATRNNSQKCPLYPVGVHEAKRSFYQRLKIKEPGPGYIHLPIHCTDEEVLKQLTAEKLMRRVHKGFTKYEFVKTRSRNEQLDMEVYSHAAMIYLNIRDWNELSENVSKAMTEVKTTVALSKKSTNRFKFIRPKQSWVMGWR